MIIVKAPFRISLFGGSTDYKGFYEQYGSFMIGTPIDKYCYISMRYRPKILSKQYLCTYSKYELTNSVGIDNKSSSNSILLIFVKSP